MDKSDYETTKKYVLSGLDVFSEVVKDENHAEFRALVIRSSCQSERWGTRTQDHSYTRYNAVITDFAGDFENIRLQAAETLVKTELGQIPERSTRVLGIHVEGPGGKAVTTYGVPNLSLSASLLDKSIIDRLELELENAPFYQEVNGEIRTVPQFKVKIVFGASSVQTSVLPIDGDGSPPCILGGDFFQKFIGEKEHLLHELLMSDHHRALCNAARCQKKHVLIAGKYGEHRERLERIKKVLQSRGFVGLILDEYPDIEEQSLPGKMVIYASICRFVVIDDLVASGHNVELEICHQRKFVAGILRARGAASTAVQDDITDEVRFIRGFDYDSDDEIEGAVREAAKWADKFVESRATRLNRKYAAWRGPNKIMGD